MDFSKIVLELPVFTVEAALKATEYGADRLEICSSFCEGGETPGAGLISYLKENIKIPVFAMIRPRGGDFVYSEQETEVMRREILRFKDLGVDGFVFGILDSGGRVHTAACKKLIEAAGSAPCTFHRAFDLSLKPEDSLKSVIDCGFSRILTSGGANSVSEGLLQIKRLLEIAKERIIIMPGGGMKPEFVAPLMETGYLREIHASCKMLRPSFCRFHNKKVRLHTAGGSEHGVWTVSREEIDRFRKVM